MAAAVATGSNTQERTLPTDEGSTPTIVCRKQVSTASNSPCVRSPRLTAAALTLHGNLLACVMKNDVTKLRPLLRSDADGETFAAGQDGHDAVACVWSSTRRGPDGATRHNGLAAPNAGKAARPQDRSVLSTRESA